MKFKEIINNALSEVKNAKALKAKACIIEPIISDVYSDNNYHFALKLCVGGQLLFEYNAEIKRITVFAITKSTKYREDIIQKFRFFIDKKTKDYLRFSVENALKHLYFVNEKNIEKRLKKIKNGK